MIANRGNPQENPARIPTPAGDYLMHFVWKFVKHNLLEEKS